MNRLLPYETIIKAQEGDPEAMNKVLSHYTGLRDRGTPGEHRPCGFRLLQTGHYRHRQNDESAGSGKRSRTQAAFCSLNGTIQNIEFDKFIERGNCARN